MTGPSARAAVVELATALLERLRRGDARELEVREGGVRVKVSKGAPVWSPPSAAEGAGPDTARAATAVKRPAAAAPAAGITAPLTGVFYRSASPQAPAFIQVGTSVSVGDVVGLIEAMKLFNEVRSTVAGRVKRVVAENGQLVRAHQTLFQLE